MGSLARRTRAVALLVLAGASAGLAGCVFFDSRPHHAEARLLPTQGENVSGRIGFDERPDGLLLTYEIHGLRPNAEYGVHVRESGMCSGAGARDAGPRFERERRRPAPLRSGDLPNIRADARGQAIGVLVVPHLALDGVRSVLGHALTIERERDDGLPSPADAPEVHIACGVIG